ncbi:ribbon-helix-helix protein, CopG family [Pantanalinema sp. GBBB05]
MKSIGFRLNDEELNSLQKTCYEQQLSISELVRRAVNEYASKGSSLSS